MFIGSSVSVVRLGELTSILPVIILVYCLLFLFIGIPFFSIDMLTSTCHNTNSFSWHSFDVHVNIYIWVNVGFHQNHWSSISYIDKYLSDDYIDDHMDGNITIYEREALEEQKKTRQEFSHAKTDGAVNYKEEDEKVYKWKQISPH